MAECGSRKESSLTDRREQSEGESMEEKINVVGKKYLMVFIHKSSKISTYSICLVRTKNAPCYYYPKEDIVVGVKFESGLKSIFRKSDLSGKIIQLN